jgi:glutamine cyclotransferase
VQLSGEDWGLCWDGNRLVQSDGTDRLRFHNATDFAVTGSVAITTRNGKPLNGLNELACWDGCVTPDDEHTGRGHTIRQARRDGLEPARQRRLDYCPRTPTWPGRRHALGFACYLCG